MEIKNKLLNYLLLLFTFIVLEGVAVLLITNNSIIQRYKFMQAVHKVNLFFWEGSTDIVDYFRLKTVNEDLAQENANLLNKIEYLKTCIPEDSVRFRNGRETDFSYIPAKVVSNSTDKLHNYMMLDKGSEDGVEPDMGVITENGIIGHISSVSRNFSQVASFLNTEGGVSAIIKKNNIFGPLVWNGKDVKEAVLREIPVHTQFRIGDTVVSSGFSSTFPPAIPLGIIKDSSQTDGINYDLKIALFENFKSLKYVYIVTNLHKHEFDSMNPENKKEEKR